VFALAGTVAAQSVLNFTPKGPAGIAVTNTTPTAADVKFTLYNINGTLASAGVTNNRSYRVPANGQLAMLTSEIFAAKDGVRTDGWIQATSSVAGLQGFYFSGDFVNNFDGAETPVILPVQTIPYLGSGTGAKTTVLVTNPWAQPVEVAVSFFETTGAGGAGVSQSQHFTLAAHQQIPVSGAGASARIVTSTPGAGVLATAVIESENELVLINGQAPDKRLARQVVPYFANWRAMPMLLLQTQDLRSRLFLTNPWSESVTGTVSFFMDTGEKTYVLRLDIPANGSQEVTWNALTGSSFAPTGDGWLLVESTSALAGITVTESGSAMTAVPLQYSPSSRILLSRASAQGWTSQLTIVGDAERDATLTVTLNRQDGTTAVLRDLNVPALQQVSGQLTDLIPGAAGFDGGFLTIRSSVPVYAMEVMGLADGSGKTAITPQPLSALYVAGVIVNIPRIHAKMVDLDVKPGAHFKITAESPLATGTSLWVGNQQISMTVDSPFGVSASLPGGLDPGFITVRVRSAGVDSNTETLGVYSADESIGLNSQVISGYALFQKIEVTDNGLDTSLTSLFPIRNARVEVWDPVTASSIFVSETDAMGRFRVPVPDRSGLTIRVLSQLSSPDIKVLNNSAGNTLYSIVRDISAAETTNIELLETSRVAGAFNILDTLQKGNAFLMRAAPLLTPPALTVYWSEKNDAAALAKLTNGAIRTTFFNPSKNEAYILGDRNTDSDEFDDSVLLHEYAHLLAAKFSRDDSNGGIHILGDLLDPRIAWSEGWANFFSSAVRGSSIYRDSKAQNTVLRFDLEENVPVGDHPGYYSEASVGGLLWDLIDENADKDDTAQFPFSAIWDAFTDLSRDRNVYLPYFLEHFLQRNPAFADGLRTMVIARSIDFQPDVRPSVTNPFPRAIAVGGFQTGQVDSLTTGRTISQTHPISSRFRSRPAVSCSSGSTLKT